MKDPINSRLGQLFILELKSARWNSRVEQLFRSAQPSGVVIPLDITRPEALLREVAEGVRSLVRGATLVGVADPQVGVIDMLLPNRMMGSPRASNNILKSSAIAAGRLRGMSLRNAGLNVDFSLRLDLGNANDRIDFGLQNPDRDPKLVAECAGAYVRGLRMNGTVACVRDFPGVGSVEFDREWGMVSAKPMAALWCEDLVPFRKLLPKLPLVMISRAVYKAYNFDFPLPAVWSPEVVTGLLRTKLGYKGVAVANLSRLGRAPKNTDIGEAAVKAVEAGCDLFVIPARKSSVASALRSLRSALGSGRITHNRVEESLQRISAMKRKLAKPLRAISKIPPEELSRRVRRK